MGMPIGHPHIATLADAAGLALSPVRGTYNGLIQGLESPPLSVDSITGICYLDVIHNLEKDPFQPCPVVLRMPSRRPSREPFRPWMVAVLEDQEG